MRVKQIPIAGHEVLEQLADYLRGVDQEEAERALIVKGRWLEDVLSGPPRTDRDMPESSTLAHIHGSKRSLRRVLPFDVEPRSVIYYPALGGMGWHTNSLAPGWRVYVPRALEAVNPCSGMLTQDGFFRDREGYVNAFEIGHWLASWHAVYSLTPRLVVGVRVSDEIALMLGLLDP